MGFNLFRFFISGAKKEVLPGSDLWKLPLSGKDTRHLYDLVLTTGDSRRSRAATGRSRQRRAASRRHVWRCPNVHRPPERRAASSVSAAHFPRSPRPRRGYSESCHGSRAGAAVLISHANIAQKCTN